MGESDKLLSLWRSLEAAVTSGLERVQWAEDEIKDAIRRHPAEADTLWHSFKLLQPTNDRMAMEFVYRGHARELLERVAAGQDTRPGTAAEICLVCLEASKVAPLTTAAMGLYLRMWSQAFPDKRVLDDDNGEHYEALKGSEIDDLESDARRRLAVPTRKLHAIRCGGRHYGETVSCKYAGK